MAILIDGQIAAYKVLGRGRPVIFLHSWVGSWRYWFPAMQFISRSFRAYGLDMWGFGESARASERYTIDQQTELLSSFLDEMGIGKIAIVGHGLGALVGFNFCVRWTQSVDRMLAVNCPLNYDAINTRICTSPPSDLVHWLGGRSPEARKFLVDEIQPDSRAIETSIDSFQANDLFDKMRQTQISCLLVYGGHDPAVQTPTAETFQSLPDMLQPVVFEKSGHFPMIDEETRFAHLLMDFLLLDSGVSPQEMRL